MTRQVAGVAALITGLATVYTLALLLGTPDPGWAYLPRGIIHLGELAAIVALAMSGAAGTGPLGRLGPGVACLGALVLAVAEVITESAPGASDTLFAIGPNLVGIGLVLTGIAVIRTGRWAGRRRYVTLVLGVYVLVVMTPVIIVAGGPPAVPAIGALLVWEVLWMLIAVATLTSTAARVTASR
ncbi:MAG: hypothetical protein JOY78_00580 [Pseudonocardia sp.]|nr:hypothetical protein [Pseudonocardia sp.]